MGVITEIPTKKEKKGDVADNAILSNDGLRR
jgi:hypothetical protein